MMVGDDDDEDDEEDDDVIWGDEDVRWDRVGSKVISWNTKTNDYAYMFHVQWYVSKGKD